jgi:hypothetical protein
MDLGEIRLGCVGCIHLAQDRDRWRALVIAGNTEKLLSGYITGGLSSSAQITRVSK